MLQLRHRLTNLAVGALVALFLAYVVWYLFRQDFQYDFLKLPFASDIGGGFFKINSSDYVWVAAVKGIGNTLVLIVFGIVLASLIGLVAGVGRLSTNPLVNAVAHLYVEVLRNIPLLVLMFVFAFVVFAGLPTIDNAAGIAGLVYVTNRGVAVPEIDIQPLWWVWLVLDVVLIPAAAIVAKRLQKIEDETGRRMFGSTAGFAGWLVVVLVAYFVLGRPVRIVGPTIKATGLFPSFQTGFVLSLGYVSALLSLSLYFGGFIAEIVRGSIQAIPKQQSEAAAALGLTPGQRFRLIILPQALRIMIPSLNNEYQNANKDSSLAHLITYSEVVFVAMQTANNRGNLIELFLAVFVVYVIINLAISLLMNTLNRMVQVVG